MVHVNTPSVSLVARFAAAAGVPTVARYRLCRCAISRLVMEQGFAKLFEAMRHVVAKLWVIDERLPSDHAGALTPVLKGITDDPERAVKISLLGLAPRPPVAER